MGERFGFVGSSYSSQSPNASDTQSMNWYLERVETDPAVAPNVNYPTGGLKLFCDLMDVPVRGEITVVDRAFVVSGSRFYEISALGVKTQWGVVINDGSIVSMAGGTSQILIASAGFVYVFDFTTNTFTPLPLGTLLGPVSFVGYCDGFFIALLANSNQFQWSQLLNALVWDGLDTQKVSVFTGNVLSMIVDHREIWFFGERQTQVYYDSGSINVFDIVPGGFIEAGIYAPNSVVRLDNTLLWLGGDERGAGVAWRAQGYTPSRVSSHAIEFAWQGYLQKFGPAGLSGAVAYPFQDQGHSFWQIYFPVPNKTWVYDAATGQWHERGAWIAAAGQYVAHHSQVHTFNFGKHLVGDWASGKVYDMSIAYLDDDGQPLRRARRAPSIFNSHLWQFHSQLEVYLESGLGPTPPLFAPSTLPSSIVLQDTNGVNWTVTIDDAGTLEQNPSPIGAIPVILFLNDSVLVNTSWQVIVHIDGTLDQIATAFNAAHPTELDLSSTPSGFFAAITVQSGVLNNNVSTTTGDPNGRDPMINLRWSDDGGHTWSNEYSVGAGRAGEYSKRVIWRRLGRTRGRIYEVNVSDPIPWRLVDSYIDREAGLDG
jgi:hypothetical protein